VLKSASNFNNISFAATSSKINFSPNGIIENQPQIPSTVVSPSKISNIVEDKGKSVVMTPVATPDTIAQNAKSPSSMESIEYTHDDNKSNLKPISVNDTFANISAEDKVADLQSTPTKNIVDNGSFTFQKNQLQTLTPLVPPIVPKPKSDVLVDSNKDKERISAPLSIEPSKDVKAQQETTPLTIQQDDSVGGNSVSLLSEDKDQSLSSTPLTSNNDATSNNIFPSSFFNNLKDKAQPSIPVTLATPFSDINSTDGEKEKREGTKTPGSQPQANLTTDLKENGQKAVTTIPSFFAKGLSTADNKASPFASAFASTTAPTTASTSGPAFASTTALTTSSTSGPAFASTTALTTSSTSGPAFASITALTTASTSGPAFASTTVPTTASTSGPAFVFGSAPTSNLSGLFNTSMFSNDNDKNIGKSKPYKPYNNNSRKRMSNKRGHGTLGSDNEMNVLPNLKAAKTTSTDQDSTRLQVSIPGTFNFSFGSGSENTPSQPTFNFGGLSGGTQASAPMFSTSAIPNTPSLFPNTTPIFGSNQTSTSGFNTSSTQVSMYSANTSTSTATFSFGSSAPAPRFGNPGFVTNSTPGNFFNASQNSTAATGFGIPTFTSFNIQNGQPNNSFQSNMAQQSQVAFGSSPNVLDPTKTNFSQHNQQQGLTQPFTFNFGATQSFNGAPNMFNPGSGSDVGQQGSQLLNGRVIKQARSRRR